MAIKKAKEEVKEAEKENEGKRGGGSGGRGGVVFRGSRGEGCLILVSQY